MLAESSSMLLPLPHAGTTRCCRDGQRVIYTSPLKALSNQKYRELAEEFRDVGLMTVRRWCCISEAMESSEGDDGLQPAGSSQVPPMPL